jgi:hypothetical protein
VLRGEAGARAHPQEGGITGQGTGQGLALAPRASYSALHG